MGWKQIQSGKIICYRCKTGILEYANSEDESNDIYTCDRCNAKFKYEWK